MFGYKPEEIIGRNGFEFMLTAESVDPVSRWRQDGAQGMVDIIGIKKDGTRFYGETASTALLWQGKQHSIVQMHDITERKQAEKALQESEQNYRGVIENLQDVFYRTDAAGDIIMTSPSVAEVFGYRSIGEVIGLNLARDFYKDPAKRLEFLEEIKKTGSVRNFEAVLKRKDGSPVIVSTSAHYYRDPDGKVLGVEGIAKDITEWKHAQEALRESEEKYRVVSEMAKDGIAIVQNNRLVYVNPSCARLAGYSVEELTGTSFLRFVAPESVVALLGIVKDTVLGRPVPEFFSTRIRHRDGHTIEIEANGTPIIWEGKNALLGIIRDVTERNRTEEALRESEEKYRNLAETMHDFILTTDFDGVITYANPAARQLVGGRDLVGVAMKEFMDQDQIKQHLEMLSARRQGVSEPLSYEWHIISPKDGSSLLLDVRSSLLMDRGKPSGILFNARNITERKQMEDEIRTLNRTLEDRVIERTRQLDASLQEKELLLREIHHRVKNNLQIVASLLNLQSRYIKDEETLAAINESQNRVKAMALVHEKLYQAKNISKISLNEFIRFLGNSLFQFYGVKSKGIAFETEISDISVDINTAVPLGLIINELISNSLKYAFPDGRKGAISVSVRQENERYLIQFRDNGIGITDGLDWRNTDSLGLRLVTSLVEQLDGTIELTKGKGTTFNISIHREKG
jgi:PAS domain S-box-containing protein